MMKKILTVFIIAFILNLIWENLHSLLYISYQGGEISQFILLRATLADAVMITLFALPFLFLDFFKRHNWLIVVIGIVVAICIEWYALGTGRWAYNEFMPIIPYLNTGLTPTIQLGLLSYFTLGIQKLWYA